MTDTITLRGLRAHGRHGVHPEERRDGQTFVVDISLRVDITAAAASDDLVDTIDYSALADRVVAIVTGDPVDLIETLAERIAGAGLEPPGVQSVLVTVHKPQAPLPMPFEDVTVTVERVRAP